MLELKKPEDLVIDDETTRALLSAMLGKWGDDAMRPLEMWIDLELLRLDGFVKGRYPAETINEENRLARAKAIFQSSVGEAVRTAMALAIEHLAKAAIDRVESEIEEKARAAKTQHARASHRDFLKEVFAIDSPPLGRPEKCPRADVERRSIAIIRAIGAGEREMGKVALVFDSDVDPSDTDAAKKLASTYKDLDGEEKRKKRERYRKLLDLKELTYEGLLKKAKRIGHKRGK
jgi:hypothetical protein